MAIRIISLEQLKQVSSQSAEFFILLNSNLRSSKWILWDYSDDSFYIENYIDGTSQKLSANQLMDRSYTNIGYAMQRGALFKDD